MAKKRANGEGNIRKRTDGRWERRYTVGHDPVTGKQVFQNVLGKTQAEVKAKLKKAIGDCSKLDFAKTGKYAKLKVRPSSHTAIEISVRHWLWVSIQEKCQGASGNA